MRKKSILVTLSVVFIFCFGTLSLAGEGINSLSIFTKDDTPVLDYVPGGILSEIGSEEGSLSGDSTLLDDQRDKGGDEEVFLVVSSFFGEDASDDIPSNNAAFIVSAGSVIDYFPDSPEALVIEILSAGSEGVVFTTNAGSYMRRLGHENGDGVFELAKNETLYLVNDQISDASEYYEFSLADVSITKVDEFGYFMWDVDKDGDKDHIFTDFYDNGDEAVSATLLEIYLTDEEEDHLEVWLDGLYEITDIRIIDGPGDSFLIIDGLTGDFYIHDIPGSFVVVNDGGELIALR